MFDNIDTPSLIIDLKTVENNIKSMVEGLRGQGIKHRPHFKAHKSVFLAKKQIEQGATGITCAKLGEAEILLDGGIDDVFVAYPIIGEKKIKRLISLSRRGKLRTVVNSFEGAAALSEAFIAEGMKADVLIELEAGMDRSPVTTDNIEQFAQKLKPLDGLNVLGVMCYRGGIYAKRGDEEYIAEAKKETADILLAAERIRSAGIEISEISAGSSFSSKFPEYLKGITESRAGNYIFNDVAQLSTGLINQEDCALTVLATVVTLPSKNMAVIDAGTKTLSGDTTTFGKGYGSVVGQPNVIIKKLSEEHGYLELPDGVTYNIGDRVRIIPNHACVVPNLSDEMYCLENGELFPICVDARGKNR